MTWGNSNATQTNTTETDYSATSSKYVESILELVYQATFYACHVSAAVAVVENLVVIILYFIKSGYVIHQRKGFTLSLAAADMLVGVTWYLQAYLISKNEVLSRLIYTCYDGMLAASVISIFVMVLDRFLLVHRALVHRRKCGKSCIIFCCVGVWIGSLSASATLSALDARMKKTLPRRRWPCGLWPVLLVAHVAYILPSLATLATFLGLHVVAVRTRLRGKQLVPSHEINRSRGRVIREAKRSVLLYSIVAFFQLFGGVLSETSNLYLTKFCGMKPTPGDFLVLQRLSGLQHVAYFIRATSSAVNPWIHTFRRQTISKCKCCRMTLPGSSVFSTELTSDGFRRRKSSSTSFRHK